MQIWNETISSLSSLGHKWFEEVVYSRFPNSI